MADIKSYRPKIKLDDSNNLSDLKIDAETVKGVDVVNSKQDVLDDNTKNINVATLTAKKMGLRYTKADGTQSTGEWNSNLVPDTDNAYDLGSSNRKWNDVFSTKGNFNEIYITNQNGVYSKILNTDTVGKFHFINPLTGLELIDVEEKLYHLKNINGNDIIKYNKATDEFHLYAGNIGYMTFTSNGCSFGYDGNIFLRVAEGESGLLDMESTDFNICGYDKINIIPSFREFGAENWSNSSYDRIKIGGTEVVRTEDETSSTVMSTIFAYKPANSAKQLVPFAITKDGKAFYQGYELITKNDSKALQTDITNIVNGTTVVAKATSATSATTATKAQNVNGYYPIQNITISGSTMTCTRTNNTKFSRTLPSGGSSTALYHHTITMSNASGQFTLIISLFNSYIIPYSHAVDVISYLFNAGFNSALTLKDTSGYYNSSSSYGYNIKGVYCDSTADFKCVCVRSTTNVKSEIMYAASDIVNVNDVVIPLIEP